MSNKVCVPDKMEDLNLSMFSMITGKKESKTLTKLISCQYKRRLDGRKCNSDQSWNNDKCWCKSRKSHVYEKDCVWTCLAGVMDDLVIIFGEVMESYKQILMKRKQPAKRKVFIFYLLFY